MIVNLGKKGLLAFCLALLGGAWAPHVQAAEQRPDVQPRDLLTAELATALDSDGQTDWIRAYPCAGPTGAAAYCVRVAVSQTQSTQTIILSTNAKGVRIASHDVDGDHLLDLLIMSAEDGHPLGVWINDGHGGFKESDVQSYPSSIWHEDPLLCPVAPPDNASFASVNGAEDYGLAPSTLRAPLPDTGRSASAGEAASPHAARRGDRFGRAPPAR